MLARIAVQRQAEEIPEAVEVAEAEEVSEAAGDEKEEK